MPQGNLWAGIIAGMVKRRQISEPLSVWLRSASGITGCDIPDGLVTSPVFYRPLGEQRWA